MVDAKVKQKIKDTLTQQGGFKLVKGANSLCSHSIGKPAGVGVVPEWGPGDCIHTIVVSPTEVFSCTLSFPTQHSTWRVRDSEAYETPDEMLQVVRDFVKPDNGCWDA